MILQIVLTIVFGAIIGWLAGLIMKSKSTLLWNIIFGIVGSAIGGFAGSLLGVGGGILGFVFSIAGACLVVFVAKSLKIGK